MVKAAARVNTAVGLIRYKWDLSSHRNERKDLKWHQTPRVISGIVADAECSSCTQRVLNDIQRTRLSCVCDPATRPSPPPHQQVVFLFMCRQSSLLTGEGERGGRGTKSYDPEKAWPSINHSILSGCTPLRDNKGSQLHRWHLRLFPHLHRSFPPSKAKSLPGPSPPLPRMVSST